MKKGGRGMKKKEMLLQTFGSVLKAILSNLETDFFETIEEIRIRAEKPLLLCTHQKEYFIKENGCITKDIQKAYLIKKEDIQQTLELLSRYSLYAFCEELRNGFFTIQGGHRIGIVGKAVVQKDTIQTIRDISALNIRISHEIKGCADIVLKYAIQKGKFYHTLIISPPGCGKTTLLRDLVRQLSNGKEGCFLGQTVAVADERGEIAGCYRGVAQNDIGIRTDVLDCCPKAEGMLMLVRSMSPRIIAVDEIGKSEDFVAIESIVNAGIQLICTVHGNDLEDVKKRDILGDMIKNGVFHTIVVLSAKERTGQIQTIYNKKLERIYSDFEKKKEVAPI